MSGITDKAHPLYAARIWKWGKSTVFPLYSAVCDAIRAVPGDLLLVRVHPPSITLRVAHPEQVMPVEQFTEEELPPPWPRKSAAADERDR
jgi:hypothetical protein